jgi:carbonic anhydrase/acetyltransferase-like protein (isoleucine patch superfamily)
MGTPGKVVRTLTDAEIAGIRAISDGYIANARRYLAHFAGDSLTVRR